MDLRTPDRCAHLRYDRGDILPAYSAIGRAYGRRLHPYMEGTRMTSSTTARTGNAGATARSGSLNTAETKPAWKTTEMLFYILTVAGVLIASQVADGFQADQAWLFVTLLTFGYMVSRGIAKAGKYAKDSDPRTDAYGDNR